MTEHCIKYVDRDGTTHERAFLINLNVLLNRGFSSGKAQSVFTHALSLKAQNAANTLWHAGYATPLHHETWKNGEPIGVWIRYDPNDRKLARNIIVFGKEGETRFIRNRAEIDQFIKAMRKPANPAFKMA